MKALVWPSTTVTAAADQKRSRDRSAIVGVASTRSPVYDKKSNAEFSVDAVLASRRTAHNYESTAVPDEPILEAIDAARWAPNHKLTEPWRFVLLGPNTAEYMAVRNAELVRQKRGDATAAMKLSRWRAVPRWMVLTCRRSEDAFREREDYGACCCAAQNWMLSLWDKGIGSKWGTGAVTRDLEFLQRAGIDPEREFIVGLFQIGFPAGIKPSKRRPVDEILSRVP